MFKFATMMKRAGIFCFFCLGAIQNVLAGHFMPPPRHFMPPTPALRSEVMAYTDVFYAYNFNRPKRDGLQVYGVNHHRHAQTNINLAVLGLKMQSATGQISGTIQLQGGTYVNDNYADEPDYLRIFHRAEVALWLKPSRWKLEAGIMPSHIGFETAQLTDNFTLSRSFIAENSPYYLTGAKLSFYPMVDLFLKKKTFFVSLLANNGWQRITPAQVGDKTAWGTQVFYEDEKRGLKLNWSTFYDNRERMGQLPVMTNELIQRFFNNVFIQKEVNTKWSAILGYDFGNFWKSQTNQTNTGYWHGGALIAQYKLKPTLFLAGRAEFYEDPNAFIVTPVLGADYRVRALSLNADWQVESGLLRAEVKQQWSNNRIFETANSFSTSATLFLLSMSFNLN